MINLEDKPTSFYLEHFINDIRSGNVEDFMTRLQAILSSVPYASAANKTPITEYTFRTNVFLIFELMGQFTQTEIRSAQGRADCVVWTRDAIYVFELKLNGTAREALAQINDNSYAVPNQADGRKIVKIGVGFAKDSAVINEWLVE